MPRHPTKPGLYWLALDEGGAWLFDRPCMVRVFIGDEWGSARIVFLDYPGVSPTMVHLPIIDEPAGNVRGFDAFRNGTMHTLQYSYVNGTGRWLDNRQQVRLVWLDPVRSPKMPRLSD